ncbi:MAG: hypothetical protein AAF318_05565 [Pseudomonadota bacterium]
MNTVITEPTGTPILLDVVREIPRRVVGFSTVIETSHDEDALRTSLEAMADESAFRLDALSAEREGLGNACRFIRAEFSLKASRGTTGDLQIFALLREIAAKHRWNGMEKHLAG